MTTWQEAGFFSDEAAALCLGSLPKFSEDGCDLLPFLGSVHQGWFVCGWPVRVASGMASVVMRVAGLYESRQAWLDRQGIAGGWRELHETCWQQADAEMEADLQEQLVESMKAKS